MNFREHGCPDAASSVRRFLRTSNNYTVFGIQLRQNWKGMNSIWTGLPLEQYQKPLPLTSDSFVVWLEWQTLQTEMIYLPLPSISILQSDPGESVGPPAATAAANNICFVNERHLQRSAGWRRKQREDLSCQTVLDVFHSGRMKRSRTEPWTRWSGSLNELTGIMFVVRRNMRVR